MVESGYAAVTYRAVAAEAGVTAGLVQYYFPTLDDVFIATIRRRSEQNLSRLARGLEEHRDRPLRFLWDFSQDEMTAALTVEFMAVGNHRPTIRSEISSVTEQVRSVQMAAIEQWFDGPARTGNLSPSALLFLLTGVPKLIRLEEGVGVSTAHDEVVRTFDRYLAAIESADGLAAATGDLFGSES